MLWHYSNVVRNLLPLDSFRSSVIGSNGSYGGRQCLSGLLIVYAICLPVLLYLMKQSRMSKLTNQILGDIIDRGYPVETAKYIVAVSAFETGNWKSEIYRKNHNLFGMKLPKIRKTTATGENLGHATYNNNSNSIVDFVHYMRYFDYPVWYNDLYGFILYMKSKGYFEADFNDYYTGVQGRYRKLFNSLG